MSEIHKALAVFGLEPGASLDAIERRYKRLIMVWHPDRFPTQEGKKDAEEELKKINNANDVLKKHFATGHRASGCECQRPAATGPGADSYRAGHGPGPGSQRKTEDPEAQAKRRDEERQRKTAAEEAARKAAGQQQQQQKPAADQYKQAQRQQEALKSNKLRWQIAAGEAALFIALCIFGSVGYGIREWWHGVTWRSQAEHSSQPANTNPSPYVDRNTSQTDTNTSQTDNGGDQRFAEPPAKPEPPENLNTVRVRIAQNESTVGQLQNKLVVDRAMNSLTDSEASDINARIDQLQSQIATDKAYLDRWTTQSDTSTTP